MNRYIVLSIYRSTGIARSATTTSSHRSLLAAASVNISDAGWSIQFQLVDITAVITSEVWCIFSVNMGLRTSVNEVSSYQHIVVFNA